MSSGSPVSSSSAAGQVQQTAGRQLLGKSSVQQQCTHGMLQLLLADNMCLPVAAETDADLATTTHESNSWMQAHMRRLLDGFRRACREVAATSMLGQLAGQLADAQLRVAAARLLRWASAGTIMLHCGSSGKDANAGAACRKAPAASAAAWG
jgi:hypothetical protein